MERNKIILGLVLIFVGALALTTPHGSLTGAVVAPLTIACPFEIQSNNVFECTDGYKLRVTADKSPSSSGYKGKGINLDASSYAFLPKDQPVLNPQEGSIELWFKPIEKTEGNIIIASGQSGNDFFSLRYNNREIKLSLRSSERGRVADESKWIETKAIGSIILKPEEWHHLAYSWKRNPDRSKPDEFYVFINGQQLPLKTEFRTEITSAQEQNSNGFLGGTKTHGNLATLPQTFDTSIASLFLGFRSGASSSGMYDELTITNRFTTKICPHCSHYQDEELVLYQKPLFGEEGKYSLIYPTTKPKPDEFIEHIIIKAVPGEFEPASFSIYARQDINNIQGSISNLRSTTGELDASNLKLQVVKVWEQAGSGGGPTWAGEFGGKSYLKWHDFGTSTKGILTPELIVFDDTEDYHDRIDEDGLYHPPNMRQQLHTNIPAGSSKQFWITAHIPKNTPAGEYRGRITLQSNQQQVLTIPITIEVLPFSLEEPHQKRWIFYRSHSYRGEALHEFVTPSMMRKELQDIKDHGFTGIDLRVKKRDETTLKEALTQAKQVGFSNIIQNCYKDNRDPSSFRCGKIDWQRDLSIKSGFEPWFFGPDEVNNFLNPSFLPVFTYISNAHKQKSNILHTIIYDTAKAFGDFNSPMYDLRVAPNEPPLRERKDLGPLQTLIPDSAAIAIPAKPSEGRGWERYEAIMNGEQDPLRSKSEFYYWQTGQHLPKKNRFHAGVLLWLLREEVEGIMPYAYQHFTPEDGYFSTPYNDFGSGFDENKGYQAPQMTTYPSADGPISTLEWEAMREGIDDLRYLTTLDKKLTILAAQNPAEAAQIRAELDRELTKFKKLNAWEYLSDQDFAKMRTFVIEKIIEIDSHQEAQPTPEVPLDSDQELPPPALPNGAQNAQINEQNEELAMEESSSNHALDPLINNLREILQSNKNKDEKMREIARVLHTHFANE